MAISCNANVLETGAAPLQGMTIKQLWAALVYIQCIANKMICTPQALNQGSACIQCLNEKELLSALVFIQCTTGGGGGGTPAQVCIIGGVGAPVGTPPCNFSVYIQQPGPNFGLWLGDTVAGWGNVLLQGP